ncbi:MAG TPA: hypothetical protein VM491_01965, partial [Burkholderiaceae bacterium]|nr:hypothetical protein [Burkholderiaceae bacterium]
MLDKLLRLLLYLMTDPSVSRLCLAVPGVCAGPAATPGAVMHRLAAAAMTAAMIAGIAGCTSEAAPNPPEVPRPVRTVVAQAQPLATSLTLPGEIRPRIETRYGFRVGGKLAQRAVSVGDRVVPGQVLARLDSTDAMPAVNAQRSNVDAARTDLQLAEVELARLRDLRVRSYISQTALDR